MDVRPERTILLRIALYAVLAMAVLGAGAFARSREQVYTAARYQEAADAGTRRQALPEPKHTLELMAVGDIMLSRTVGRMMAEREDWAYPFREIRETTAAADLAIGNLEGPISERGAKQGSMYSFRADPRAVAGLTDAGFDILSIANNHIWDYGPVAVRDTLLHLSRAGIDATGGGEDTLQAHTPVLRTTNGIRVAFLGYTNLIPTSRDTANASPAIAYLDPEIAALDIARARNEADAVVVLIHWGDEYVTRASAAQRAIAHALIDAGATVIIGHHPHVAQEVETYHSGLIAYSLGNFVFDQNFSEGTRRGLGLRVILDRKGIASYETLPFVFSRNFQPMIASSTL